MNKLYDAVDAIMTKPGGVTISEALQKRLPIFVHSMLPGQEKINLRYLTDEKLVFVLDQDNSLEMQVLKVLKNQKKMKCWEQAVDSYQNEIVVEPKEKLVDLIESVFYQQTKSKTAELVMHSKIFHSARAQ